jgi:acyl-CoA thioester hydrolase
MLSSVVQLRVRYAETDRMGYVYYGHYATYFEVARVEMLRELGFTYKKLEDEGVLLPVVEYHINYFRPAYYDDFLTIKTTVKQLPAARITFHYETWNESGILLNKAVATLVFVNKVSGKPTAIPKDLEAKMKEYF